MSHRSRLQNDTWLTLWPESCDHFKINCDEFTTFYRGFNLKKLNNFHLKNISSKGYSFAMETVYQIHKKGINIKEIPISFKGRLKGYSKIPKIELFRTLINVFRLKFLSKY